MVLTMPGELKKIGSMSAKVRRLLSCVRGVAMLEFSLLLMPFLVLLFAIVEVILTFTAQQILIDATSQIAREIKIGKLTSDNLSREVLIRRICSHIEVILSPNCSEIEVDIKSYDKFSAVPTSPPLNAVGDVNAGAFSISPGGTGSINHMQVLYRRKVLVDFVSQRLSTLKDGKILIYAADVWRNE